MQHNYYKRQKLEKVGRGEGVGSCILFCVSILWFLWRSLHSQDNLFLSVTAPIVSRDLSQGQKKEIIKTQKL